MLKLGLVQTDKHSTIDLLHASEKEAILWYKANPIWVDCSHFVAGINKL